jgi:hypothetical protein
MQPIVEDATVKFWKDAIKLSVHPAVSIFVRELGMLVKLSPPMAEAKFCASEACGTEFHGATTQLASDRCVGVSCDISISFFHQLALMWYARR